MRHPQAEGDQGQTRFAWLRAPFPVAGWLVLLGATIWLARLSSQVNNPGIVGLEFAGTTDKTRDILSRWARSGQLAKAHSSVWPWDVGLILTYVPLIAALCLWGRKRLQSPGARKAAAFLASGIVLAGLLDLIEDVGLVKMMAHPSSRTWPQAVWWLAGTKFLLIALAAGFGIATALNRVALAAEELLGRLSPGGHEPTVHRYQALAAELTGRLWSVPPAPGELGPRPPGRPR